MDGNWGFFEPATTALKGHLGLQLMTTMAAEKPLFNGGVSREQPPHHQHHHHHHHHYQQPQPQLHHHHQIQQPNMNLITTNSDGGGLFHHHHRLNTLPDHSVTMDSFFRENWYNQNREKYLNYGVLPESSSSHSMQINLPKIENPEPSHLQLHELEESVTKKRKAQPEKSPKPKKQNRSLSKSLKDDSTPSVQRARAPKKSAELLINGITMDISGIPIPVCTCTGNQQQCYRWGSGGWQSACCTTGMSKYPLPMNEKRRGARIAGRKISIGAFKKVLEKLASENYDFSNAIDLKNYWAKHGTNKFVTIR